MALAQRAARGRAGQPPGKLSKKTLAQRVRRLQRRMGARHSQSVAERTAIAHAWNHARLRHGERLHDGSAPVNGRQKAWRHPLTWTAPGTIGLGFACVGRLSQKLLGQRQTRRDIDAISAVALAHQARQRSNVKTLCLQVEAGVERLGWVLLERAFDCTPVRVRPGSCTRELAPKMARRWWIGDHVKGGCPGAGIF